MRYQLVGLAAVLCVSGCASVVRGTTEKVVLNALPADSAIRTSLGHSCPASPCTVEVSRKSEFTMYAEKPGYKPGSHYIGTKFSDGGAAGLAGNILVGGIIGVGVDAASGATLDHFPNPALITLVPVAAAEESTNVAKPEKKPPPPAGTPVS